MHLLVPQQLACMGFWRLGEDIQYCTGSSLASVVRQLVCAGAINGDTHARLVYAKRMRALHI